MLGSAQPSLEFLLDRALGQLPKGAPIEVRVRAVDAVKGIVQAAPSPLARDLYVEKVAEKIGAGADAIRRALAGKALTQPAAKASPRRGSEPEKPLPVSVLKAEVVILAAVVRHPELAQELAHSAPWESCAPLAARGGGRRLLGAGRAGRHPRGGAGLAAPAPARRGDRDGAGRRPD